LANEAKFLERRLFQFLGDGDHAKRDRKIETRAFFLYVGRREIDRGPSPWPVIAAVTIRGRDAIAAFFYRGIGQANNDDLRLSPRAVDLDLHVVGIDCINSSGVNVGVHGRSAKERGRNLSVSRDQPAGSYTR